VRDKISILNPVEHGARWTGLNRAERYVASKRAVWVSHSSIRLIEADPRNQAARERARNRAAAYDGVTRLMTESELANIPVLMPRKLLWRT